MLRRFHRACPQLDVIAKDPNERCFVSRLTIKEYMERYTNVIPDAKFTVKSLKALVLDHRHDSLQLSALVLMDVNFGMRDGPIPNSDANTKAFIEGFKHVVKGTFF